MNIFYYVVLIFSILLATPAYSENQTVKFTSLEWPPYTSTEMANQGASVAVAKAAFKAVGIDLVVDFYPWKRAVHLAKNQSDYDGYFPEYYADSLKQDFILSEPIGSGPLGFAELKSQPVNWEILSDLIPYKIGLVSDYVNTAELDAMIAGGSLSSDYASDDLKNLLKLQKKRHHLAVIDKNVLNHLLATEPRLKAAKAEIQFNKTLLEDKSLYLCFTKNHRGKVLVEKFNQGLKLINVNQIMASAF